MSIYNFKPTYLYIKQHSVTGKLYFGKTNSKNPEKYLGSGKHWIRHVNKHGEEYVVTLWYDLFEDMFELVCFALSFSHKMDIVESEQWLNLKVENGLDGGGIYGFRHSEETKSKMRGQTRSPETKAKMSLSNIGRVHSTETRIKLSKAQSGKKASDATRIKMSLTRKGKVCSDETKVKLSEAKLGKRQILAVCPYCLKTGGNATMKRWHFDRCKMKE